MHPQINIKLDFSSRRVNLVSGEFDLVFRMGQLQDSSLICRKLIDLPIMTLATEKYLSQYEKLTHPKDLKNHQCITGSVKHWSFSNKIDPAIKVDIAIEGQFQCKNGRAMLISALADNGIVRVPKLYCEQEVKNKDLISVFDEWEIPDTPLYMVYVQNKFMPNKLKVFIEFVVNNFNRYL
ncbi:substrate binding domain-containing protein [Pseudoalteromonas denitrificans]|uniref:substrate binding domain-containing protein n=1 Tax=Pseudoalteromonas denitrificans TaxID=43656 RepID=UPI002481CBC1|nr:substrate binding domain-containing protein [Pseudoalteromonas denitrificans]